VTQVLCPIVVGRDAELEALDGALDDLASGRGACAVVAGEAGIGKSRLVRELAARATARGYAVVTGRAVPASTSAPYRPVTEALLQLVRDRDVPTGDRMARWLPALRAIVPSLGAEDAGETTTDDTASVPAALRGEALLQLLRRVAPEGAVMILEDLHWADPDTVALVEYVLDNAVAARVVCAVTLRTEQPSAALELVRRRRPHPGVAVLRLARLDDDAVDEMLTACGAVAASELARRVRHAAEGVPLLIEDLLASRGLPESITESVRARLAELPADERAVLEAAAVMGRHFDWELLAAASGRPDDVVTAALAHGVDRLLVAASDGGFRFRHALTRDAVLAGMLPPEQRTVATKCLSAVDSAHPALDGAWRDVAADLAWRAGDRHRAGRLMTESAAGALRMGALATAVDTAQRAVELLPHGPDRTHAELLWIETLSLAGRVDEAAAAGNAVIARLGDDPATDDVLRLEVHLRLARAAIEATRWSMAEHHLRSAARVAGDPPPPLAARLAVLSAEIALAGDDLDGARAAAARVLEGDDLPPAVRCHAYEIVGRTQRLHDLAGARRAFEAALATAEEAGLAVWALRALHELGTIDMFDHVGVDRLLDAHDRAEQMGALSTAATLDLQLAACYTSRWELDRCDAHAHAALDIAERLGLGQVRAKALAMLTGSASMRGDIGATDALAARTRAAAPDDRMIEGFTLACQGQAALMAGDLASGLDVYRRGMAVLSRLPNAEPAANRALWPVVLAAIGDRRASDAIAEARRLGVEAFHLNRGLVSCAEAILAGRAGDPRRAEDLVAAAAVEFVNGEMWAVLARFLVAPAARTDRWGKPAQWLEEAVDAFAAHGLDQLAAEGRRALRADDPNPWSAAGITNREADVLRLVADGLTNKDIGARLGVSARTVEKHVESLLRKTGTRTRVELALHAGTPTT